MTRVGVLTVRCYPDWNWLQILCHLLHLPHKLDAVDQQCTIWSSARSRTRNSLPQIESKSLCTEHTHCLLNFAGELKQALMVILRRAVGEWLLTDNASYHTAKVCKVSGKLLRPNKVKVSMCKQLLSLYLSVRHSLLHSNHTKIWVNIN